MAPGPSVGLGVRGAMPTGLNLEPVARLQFRSASTQVLKAIGSVTKGA